LRRSAAWATGLVRSTNRLGCRWPGFGFRFERANERRGSDDFHRRVRNTGPPIGHRPGAASIRVWSRRSERVARLVAALAVLLATFVFAAPGLASTRESWHSCGARLQCTRVWVPLDWARPHGAKISLAVDRYLATRPAKRMRSLFVNGGGASGSVGLVRSDGARLDALARGRFDVVGWALRGGAGAEPAVRCFADQRTRQRFWDGLSIPNTAAQARAYLPNLSRRDLRQHVSASGAGDGARWSR
jgi:hypothetical protein